MASVMSRSRVDKALEALGGRVDPEAIRRLDSPWHRWVALSAGLFLSDQYSRHGRNFTDNI
jgi:hypothetical protein